jgi:hypothetical protein
MMQPILLADRRGRATGVALVTLTGRTILLVHSASPLADSTRETR